MSIHGQTHSINRVNSPPSYMISNEIKKNNKMKQVMTICGALLFASTILTSCSGGSIESDAKRVAELQCKAQKLMQRASAGDMTLMDESARLTSETLALTREIEEKYISYADKKKFGEALLKEMGNCE